MPSWPQPSRRPREIATELPTANTHLTVAAKLADPGVDETKRCRAIRAPESAVTAAKARLAQQFGVVLP